MTDPTDLFDRDDVDHCEDTFPHEDEDHCEAGYAGRAIVGVTNDDGALLLHVNEEIPHAILPNVKVEPGEDWVAAGRRAAEERTGVEAHVESPVRVREVDHVVEGEDEPFQTTHHVVFSASPEAENPKPVDPREDAEEDEWEVEWVDGFPAELDEGNGASVDDVRLFVD